MSGVKGKSGRPKGSKNKSKDENLNMMPVENSGNIVIEGNKHTEYESGEDTLGVVQKIVTVKKKVKYAFQYVADDGSTLWVIDEGGITFDVTCKKNNGIFYVTEWGRDRIYRSIEYRDGLVVEVNIGKVNDATPNILSDKQLEALFNLEKEKIKEHINRMDSIFAVRRIRNYAISNDKPASVIKVCDAKITELEEEEESKNIAPIANQKGEILNPKK